MYLQKPLKLLQKRMYRRKYLKPLQEPMYLQKPLKLLQKRMYRRT